MARHTESCRACKSSLAAVLRTLFGEVREQYDLGLPARISDYRGYGCFAELSAIHDRLCAYREHRDFVKGAKLPRADYFLPELRTVVEFDESQHFTTPRALSLEAYPPSLEPGYSRERWIQLCRRLDRRDNLPPYRDEQRAWYDTLRDFSPVLAGNRPTIRLFARDRRWCTLDPGDARQLEELRQTCFLPMHD